MVLTIETIRPGEHDRIAALGRQAFGGTDRLDPSWPQPAPERRVGAYDGDRLVATCRRHGFLQVFGGRPVPCAGISGVTVAPEVRGQGVAKRMLAETRERALADGEPVASLFPTTATLYRAAGFEIAGWWGINRIPVDALPAPDPAMTWEAVPYDDPRCRQLYESMARGFDGWVLPEADWWSWRAGFHASQDEKENRFNYVGSREGEPVAWIRYRYDDAVSPAKLYRIDVDLAAGVDGAAIRGALGFLGANGTTVDEVRTTWPEALLGLHLEHPQRVTAAERWPWMVALWDVPGAMAARGWPPAVSGAVPLRLGDTSYVLEVADGEAALSPGGDGRVTVDERDLARLYTGHLDPAWLAADGRLPGATGDDVAFLRAAFAGHPTLAIFF